MVPDPTSRALERLSRVAEMAAPHELADLFDGCARELGALNGLVYVVDLQQRVLQPLTSSGAFEDLAVITVDGTLAGRAYQMVEPQTQVEEDQTRLWLPVSLGSYRLGVLTAVLQGEVSMEVQESLTRLAHAAAVLIQSKSVYGDTIVRLRRSHHLGIAAELHFSVLPPLSYVSTKVTVSAALEPCYEVAGDVIDYSVDPGRTQVAVFDGMGHGLHSAQCAVFTVAAYRSARRSGMSLVDVLTQVDQDLVIGLGVSSSAPQ